MQQINSITNPVFQASRINIISTADNHGDILKIPQLVKAIQMNKGDLFQKSAEKSTLNLLAIAGDYFMNPRKMGFLHNPKFSGGDIQYNFLQKLLYTAKYCSGKGANFDAIFTPGNHDLDGGDRWLFNKMSKSTVYTLTTNVDRSRSPLIGKLTNDESVRIQASKIFEIPDSRNPEKINHLLTLGVTIPSMNYFNPGLLKGTVFYDNSNKNDSLIEERDIRKTLRVIKFHVKQFKQKYPDGAVIVLSHMGNKISRMIAKVAPEVNLILNGHDHKEFESIIGSTLILSHGQASNFFRGSQLTFEDDGSISVQSRKYETEKYEQIARKDRKMQEFINTCIKDDLVPLVKYENPGATPEELVLNDSIRYANSVMINYITSGLKSAAKDLYPDVDLVGIPSTIFRNGLKSNEKRSTLNNIDFLKIFDGVNDNLAPLKIGTVTGKQLYDLILENVLNNLKSRTRNAMIQWSDIQINRTLIKDIKNSNSDDSRLIDAIKIRDNETGRFVNIDFNKEYKMIFSDKYLIKDTENIRIPAQIKANFQPINLTYDMLFRKYLESIDYNIKIGSLARESRIL